jgi:TetR/AcrR family transcriptional repressor of nem operon
MRYPAGHKDGTRAQILREATHAIRTDGLHQLSVGTVMARVGLTHGGFYGHFPSKNGLLEAAIEAMFTEANARMAAATDDKNPAEALTDYIDDYLSQGKYNLCPIVAVAAHLPYLPAGLRKTFSRGVQGLTTGLATHIRAMGISDADALASSILTALSGAVSTARALSDPRQIEIVLGAARSALRQLLGLPLAP